MRLELKSWTTVAVFAILACLVLGCEPPGTQPEGRSELATEPKEGMWQSARGLYVREGRMRQLLAQITREVAVALSDESVRKTVYRRHPTGRIKFTSGGFSKHRAGLCSAEWQRRGLQPKQAFSPAWIA